MTFTDKTAINFFIQKILEQAKKDNISLSEAQQYILSLNGYGPDSFSNRELVKSFEGHSNIKKFERTTMKLLSRAYRHDISINSTLLANYQEAHRTLKSGDYYIYHIVDRAIGNNINKIGKFFDDNTADEYMLWSIFTGLFASFCIIILLADFVRDKDPILTLRSNSTIIIGTIVCILALILSIRRYSTLTNKGIYDIRFRKQIDINNEPSSVKAFLGLAATLVAVIALISTYTYRLIDEYGNGNYVEVVFLSIIVILLSWMFVLMLKLLFVARKINVESQNRKF